MKYCKNCGAQIEDSAAYCTVCGANQNENKSKASNHISDDVKKFGSTESDNVSPKSRAIASVLAICLGGIGIHEFYLGKVGSGICMLLFSWTFIPSIIAFIHFIILICGEGHDAEGKEVKKW